MGKSQFEVETQLHQQWAEIRKTRCIIDAFGTASDWIVELGKQKILLNPFYKSWLYYHHTHDTWDETGYRVGEALFFEIDNILNAISVPGAGQEHRQMVKEHQPLNEWYIFLYQKRLSGPVLKAELMQKLYKGLLPVDILVFNGEMTEWQKAGSVGLIPPTAPAAKPKVTSKTPIKASASIKSETSIPQPTSPLSCPKCKTEYIDGDIFCANCGIDLRVAYRVCPDCKQQLEPDDVFCPNCGRKLWSDNLRRSEESTVPETPICPECGAPLKRDASFCMKCGHKL